MPRTCAEELPERGKRERPAAQPGAARPAARGRYAPWKRLNKGSCARCGRNVPTRGTTTSAQAQHPLAAGLIPKPAQGALPPALTPFGARYRGSVALRLPALRLACLRRVWRRCAPVGLLSSWCMVGCHRAQSFSPGFTLVRVRLAARAFAA